MDLVQLHLYELPLDITMTAMMTAMTTAKSHAEFLVAHRGVRMIDSTLFEMMTITMTVITITMTRIMRGSLEAHIRM